MRVQGIVSPKHTTDSRELERAIEATRRLTKLVIALVIIAVTLPVWAPVGMLALIAYCFVLVCCGGADYARARIRRFVQVCGEQFGGMIPA